MDVDAVDSPSGPRDELHVPERRVNPRAHDRSKCHLMSEYRWTPYWLAVALASLGLLLSAVSYSAELSDWKKAHSPVCGAGDECRQLHQSEWSVLPPARIREALNLPVSVQVRATLAGVWHFSAALVGLILIGPPRGRVMRWWKILWGGELAATSLYSGFLLGVMVVHKTYCPLCAAIHAVVVAMSTCLYRMWVVENHPTSNRKSITAGQLAAPLLLIVSLGGNLLLLDRLITRDAVAERENGTEAFLAKEVRNVPVADDDSVLPASKSADHTLVVFFDVQCQPCRRFLTHLLTEIVPLRSDSLRVVFKHYPLNSECNPGVNDIHPQACEFARILEAAREEGGMDAFHRFLLLLEPLNASPTEDDFDFLCKQMHVDASRVKAAVDQTSIKERVRRHIDEGKSLGISGTPSLFLDGRELDLASATSPAFWNRYLEKIEIAP